MIETSHKRSKIYRVIKNMPLEECEVIVYPPNQEPIVKIRRFRGRRVLRWRSDGRTKRYSRQPLNSIEADSAQN